VQRAPV